MRCTLWQKKTPPSLHVVIFGFFFLIGSAEGKEGKDGGSTISQELSRCSRGRHTTEHRCETPAGLTVAFAGDGDPLGHSAAPPQPSDERTSHNQPQSGRSERRQCESSAKSVFTLKNR